ncbi:MAG: BREX-1 system adenine-specific DNA-methyltransferase PglX [Bifidobacterium tibiigranuli]|jgi:hypothetical protein|uniref:Eco57I restriction-modification methylase domain-containing protein n=1 Tax=Bifidobacterium tibiigranuli TaxID=2172043 RepID=UPI0023549442|nr:hypothetical protein [Bifidobacterium tibiigranuli]MCH4203891.1 BREX-1 system adenine-specific DNA-methyltransferase PglX [Bifidobacterium tibiigranuli]MCH4274267.1 BREX-1 system adenine-specific DNA-methyltransferase PglX [Bifidobacterium tibiigranuli]
MKEKYPDGKSDLFAAFIERCLSLIPKNSFVGLMTPMVWMFIFTYKQLRKRLITQESISSLIQLEYSGFEGATVPICTFVLHRGASASRGAFVRLNDFVGPALQGPKALEIIQADSAHLRGEATNGMEKHLYRRSAVDFVAIPGLPVAYWLSEKKSAVFTNNRSLNAIASLAVGLQTGDNSRFLREWWEVSRNRTAFACTSRQEAAASGARWFPYNKGGDFRKWYGNQEYVVNWEHDGQEIRALGTETGGRPRSRAQNVDTYFSPSVSWSKISSGAPAFRYYPAGFIFDVAGTSIFASTNLERAGLLSFLNSQIALEQLAAVAPTLNYEVGQVASLPVAESVSVEDHTPVQVAVKTSQADEDQSETSWGFQDNPLVHLTSEVSTMS